MDDVHRLSADPSPKARAAFAAKFGRQYDRLVRRDAKDLAHAVLHLLIKDGDATVRRSLAENIAISRHLPAEIAGRLASDEIAIARPILAQSPVIEDAELIRIVHSHAIQYAFAIAGRATLSKPVVDRLIGRHDPELIERVLANHGAAVSDDVLQMLADDYRDDGAIQNLLIKRPDLPAPLVGRFLTAIGEQLTWDLVTERRISSSEARRLTAAAKARRGMSRARREQADKSLARILKARIAEGGLSGQDVLIFLRDGNIQGVEATLALLARLDLAKTRRLLYSHDLRSLAALCIRAGLGTPHYLILRMVLELAENAVKSTTGRRTTEYGDKAFRFVQDQYERLRRDERLVAKLIG